MERLLDPNLRRITEGLRLLQEIAGSYLNDRDLEQEMDALHQHVSGLLADYLLPPEARGRQARAPSTGASPDLTSLVSANARMVQESLRVLEEVARLPDVRLDAMALRHARETTYAAERRLLSALLRLELSQALRGLYVIVDPAVTAGRSATEIARAALNGGASVIQLRAKEMAKGDTLPLAREIASMCREAGAIFLVNDHPDLAVAAGADGVHLGQHDLPIAEARKVLSPQQIAGRSNATLHEAIESAEQGADYVAVGAIFPTTTKEKTRPAGPETLRRVRSAVSTPLAAIGGINEENVAQVVEAGADMICVISAVGLADDPEGAAARLVAAIQRAKA